MSQETVYTAITFAPVQGFIEKSRKLRDLYGSSFLLSYLARAICIDAEKHQQEVISPALLNITQGTPNQIIIRGPYTETFTEKSARAAFQNAWKAVVEQCRIAIETKLSDYKPYSWQRAWDACNNHTWEFFWAQTLPQDADQLDRIGDVRRRLNEKKRSRDWTGINWGGESSTLSGADAIAWPRMVEKFDGTIRNQQIAIGEFYTQLSQSQNFTESIIDPDERLSIPEIIKRLITLDDIADALGFDQTRPSIEIPPSFTDINRHNERRWTCWFQGDGDRIGEFLQAKKAEGGDEATILKQFSKALMDWGANLRQTLPDATANTGYSFIDTNNRTRYKTGRLS